MKETTEATDEVLLEVFLAGSFLAAELIAEEHEVDLGKFRLRYQLTVELAENLDQVFADLLVQLRQNANAGHSAEDLSKILWVAAREHAVHTLQRSGIFGSI